MIKVKVGKKAPMMEKKKQLNELDPLSMAAGAGIVALLAIVFKYLGPVIANLLPTIGKQLETTKQDLEKTIEKTPEIPQEKKTDYLAKLRAIDKELNDKLKELSEQTKDPASVRKMQERPSAIVANIVRRYNAIIEEVKKSAAGNAEVQTELDKHIGVIKNVALQISKLDLIAAIGSTEDTKGLYRKLTTEIPAIKGKIQGNFNGWSTFASMLAQNATPVEEAPAATA